MVIAVIIAIVFCFASHVYTEAFFAQRAHLEIGRAINCDMSKIVRLEWMDSYKGLAFAKIIRWIMLIVAFYFYGWKLPVGLYIMEFLYITFRPVPIWSYQEVMQWFNIVARENENLRDLYNKAQIILHSKGINV